MTGGAQVGPQTMKILSVIVVTKRQITVPEIPVTVTEAAPDDATSDDARPVRVTTTALDDAADAVFLLLLLGAAISDDAQSVRVTATALMTPPMLCSYCSS